MAEQYGVAREAARLLAAPPRRRIRRRGRPPGVHKEAVLRGLIARAMRAEGLPTELVAYRLANPVLARYGRPCKYEARVLERCERSVRRLEKATGITLEQRETDQQAARAIGRAWSEWVEATEAVSTAEVLPRETPAKRAAKTTLKREALARAAAELHEALDEHARTLELGGKAAQWHDEAPPQCAPPRARGEIRVRKLAAAEPELSRRGGEAPVELEQ